MAVLITIQSDSFRVSGRVLTAIDYLDQQGLIELQTKQMTQVYKVDKAQISPQLRDELTQRFVQKETSEIKCIHHLLDFLRVRSV